MEILPLSHVVMEEQMKKEELKVFRHSWINRSDNDWTWTFYSVA